MEEDLKQQEPQATRKYPSKFNNTETFPNVKSSRDDVSGSLSYNGSNTVAYTPTDDPLVEEYLQNSSPSGHLGHPCEKFSNASE